MCLAFSSPGYWQGPSSFFTYFLAKVNGRMRGCLYGRCQPREAGKGYSMLVFSLCESPGGSETLVYTVYLGESHGQRPRNMSITEALSP